MMTPKELALIWLGAAAYTGYACGIIFLGGWLGDGVGAVVGGVLALAPLIAWTFWMVSRP